MNVRRVAGFVLAWVFVAVLWHSEPAHAQETTTTTTTAAPTLIEGTVSPDNTTRQALGVLVLLSTAYFVVKVGH